MVVSTPVLRIFSAFSFVFWGFLWFFFFFIVLVFLMVFF